MGPSLRWGDEVLGGSGKFARRAMWPLLRERSH